MDIRDGERTPVVAALGAALLSVSALIIARTTGDSLFLSTFSSSALPYFFIISSVAAIAISLCYAAILRRHSAKTLNIATLIVFVLLSVGARFGIHLGEPVLYAICVSLSVVPPVANIIAWNAIADRFDTRQSKRLFPMFFAGSTVGAILGGALTGPFISAFGLDNLLLVVGGLYLLMILVVVVLASGTSDEAPVDELTQAPQNDKARGILGRIQAGFSDAFDTRLLRIVTISVFCTTVATTILDYFLMSWLQATYTKDEIGTFYGVFNAISNTANLTMQLLVVSWATQKLGLARVFRLVPSGLAATGLVFAIVPGLAAAVAMKFVDLLLRFTFHNPAHEMVMGPVHHAKRSRAKMFIKGAMNPLGAVLAGLILLPAANHWLPPHTYLSAVFLTVVALWLYSIRGIKKAYTEELQKALRGVQGPLAEMRSSMPSSADVLRSSSQWSALNLHTFLSNEREVDDLEDGLLSMDPTQRFQTLDLLVGMTQGSRSTAETAACIRTAIYESLVWRECAMAYALMAATQEISIIPGETADQARELLARRLQGAKKRIVLAAGLLTDVELLEAAERGLDSDTDRVRAHAMELLDSALEGTPVHTALVLLFEETDTKAKLAQAAKLGEPLQLAAKHPIAVLAREKDTKLAEVIDTYWSDVRNQPTAAA